MAYFLFERATEASTTDPSHFAKKRELLKGASRNNFCILL